MPWPCCGNCQHSALSFSVFSTFSPHLSIMGLLPLASARLAAVRHCFRLPALPARTVSWLTRVQHPCGLHASRLLAKVLCTGGRDASAFLCDRFSLWHAIRFQRVRVIASACLHGGFSICARHRISMHAPSLPHARVNEQ